MGEAGQVGICRQCAKSFLPHHPWERFCGQLCLDAWFSAHIVTSIMRYQAERYDTTSQSIMRDDT